MNGLPGDYDGKAKAMDMRRVMFKASPELSDGERSCTYPDVASLCDAIIEFAKNYDQPHDAGESFTVEIVALTDVEFEMLPEI